MRAALETVQIVAVSALAIGNVVAWVMRPWHKLDRVQRVGEDNSDALLDIVDSLGIPDRSSFRRLRAEQQKRAGRW